MRDILPDLEQWKREKKSIALATVIETWGSSPRRAGAKMAITPEGGITGSVSGGCVEGAVFEEGAQVLKKNRPKLIHYGVADDAALEVGLACGGTIDIFVKPLDDAHFSALRNVIAEEKAAANLTVVRGPDSLFGKEMLILDDGQTLFGDFGDLDTAALVLADEVIANGETRRAELAEGVEVFAEAILPPPTLIAVGGVHIAIALMELAKTMGYRTVVVDPRAAFGNRERFPHVDRLIQKWPQEAFQEIPLARSAAVAMLTHDPKLDDPALMLALPSKAFYVGALGSKSTQAKRRQRLLDEGLTEEQMNRLHGPIGININAGTPEEIALSIMAEVVRARNNAQK